MDTVSKEVRSRNMAAIKSKNTKPEIAVRKFLHSSGYRYRLHRKDLPGKPDIVLKKYHKVIFVHGCFWHNHPNCKKSGIPKTNTSFWKDKIDKNVFRDEKNICELESDGWNVYIVWECETENKTSLTNKINEIFRT